MTGTLEGHRRWVQSYYPGLDGLRGVAIVLVYLRHYGILVIPAKIFYAGWVGVDLFFVLSGFLITGILYDSRRLPRYYRNFYVRRALRILPLLYLLFFIAAFLKFFGLVRFHHDLWSYALFFGNLILPFVDLQKHNPTTIDFALCGHSFQLSIGYLWSLCVEEQFYLVWPVIIARIAERRRLMLLCVVLIITVLFLRIAMFLFAPQHVLATSAIYSLTFTRVDTLLVGAWLALWLRGSLLKRSTLRRIGGIVGGGSALLLLIGVGATIGRWPTLASNPFLSTIGYTLVAVSSASLLLLTLDDEFLLTKVLVHPWLIGLGTISYGFYILHDLPLSVIEFLLPQLSHGLQVVTVGLLFLTVAAAAAASFLFFESRFLRLKAVLAGHPRDDVDQPGL